MPRRPTPYRLPAKFRKILSELSGSLANSYAQRLRRDLFAALRLHHWLTANPVTTRPSVVWGDSLYRIAYGDFDPLSVAGSLADGGRFNIGGAQLLPATVMPGMRKAACLYGASTIHCAKLEAAEPLGRYRMFRLKPKKPLTLWDLTAVLSATKYPGLAASVNATPMSQRWALQKSPLESQILAHHLREIGGDGMVHSSQKDSSGQVLAFFCKDDWAAHQAFDSIDEPADSSNQ